MNNNLTEFHKLVSILNEIFGKPEPDCSSICARWNCYNNNSQEVSYAFSIMLPKISVCAEQAVFDIFNELIAITETEFISDTNLSIKGIDLSSAMRNDPNWFVCRFKFDDSKDALKFLKALVKKVNL